MSKFKRVIISVAVLYIGVAVIRISFIPSDAARSCLRNGTSLPPADESSTSALPPAPIVSSSSSCSVAVSSSRK